MQALAVRPDQEQASLTAQQSLQSVQTLLKASLGCITYLRNLLPSENFSTSYLTSSGSASLSSQPSMGTGSFASDGGKRTVSGFKIMTVTRGFTEEADKLLDYMENGIFDALQKQYLRSFILAVFLDIDDPNNIIEAYTFNFDYYKIPGTDVFVPVMTLDADLERLSLHGKKTFDPVTDASREGRVPTLGEVKKSLKTLIKNLIQATTQMDVLPKRRFATFKLFYNESTPDDYEPMHFHAGDAKKDRWFFTTHGKAEAPERCSIGALQTGHHGVNVRIASVSGYIPSAEDNNAPFVGTTSGHPHAAPVLTPVEEAELRRKQVEAQRRDAKERHVVWDADDGMCDADADGEKDPDYDPDPCTVRGKADTSDVDLSVPMGIRDAAGKIKPYTEIRMQQCGDESEVHYAGRAENVPRRIAHLAPGKISDEQIQGTQPLEETQVIDTPGIAPSPRTSSPEPSPSPTPQPRARKRTARRIPSFDSSLPPSDVLPESIPSESPSFPEPDTIDTQLVKDLIIHACTTGEDTEMLELDTQVVPSSIDSVHSFTSVGGKEINAVTCDVAPQEGIDVVDCECGVNVEDCDCVKCEGACKKWYHAWCMGFQSARDRRIPARFLCFDCRVRADQNWELIVLHDLYPRMMERFRDLAIFRRAIKIFETMKPDCLSAFTKLIACDSIVAGQIFKRLETEGFITLQAELPGFESSRGKGKNNGRAKAKGRQPRRKTMQKPLYALVGASTLSQAYKDYFDPDPEVEKRVLGLSDLKPRRRSRRKRTTEDIEMAEANNSESHLGTEVPNGDLEHLDVLGSRTQQETQLADPLSLDELNDRVDGHLKRRSGKTPDQLQTRPSKKVKISLGLAVDLGD